jgi:hypothetical protein
MGGGTFAHSSFPPVYPSARRSGGIVNLSGRGMLIGSVARQLGSGNSFDRLLCCPAQAERGRKRRSGSAKLTMPFRSLDPFRALREPDSRRRDEERLSRSEQRTPTNQKQPLDRKSPIQVRIRFPPAESSKTRTKARTLELSYHWQIFRWSTG